MSGLWGAGLKAVAERGCREFRKLYIASTRKRSLNFAEK